MCLICWIKKKKIVDINRRHQYEYQSIYSHIHIYVYIYFFNKRLHTNELKENTTNFKYSSAHKCHDRYRLCVCKIRFSTTRVCGVSELLQNHLA